MVTPDRRPVQQSDTTMRSSNTRCMILSYSFHVMAILTIVYHLVYDYNRVSIGFTIKIMAGFIALHYNVWLFVILIEISKERKQVGVTPGARPVHQLCADMGLFTARTMIISQTFLAITAITILYHFVYHYDYCSIGLIFKIATGTSGLNLIVAVFDNILERERNQSKKETVNVTIEPPPPPPPPPPPIRKVYNIQPIKFSGDRITILKQLLQDIPCAPLDGISVKEAIISKVTDDSDIHLMRELLRTDIHNLHGLKKFILSARIPKHKVDRRIQVSFQRLNSFELVRDVSQLSIVLKFLEQELYLSLIASINIIVSLITTGCLRTLPNKKELLTRLVRIDENQTDINEFSHHLLKSHDLDEYFCRPAKPVNATLG